MHKFKSFIIKFAQNVTCVNFTDAEKAIRSTVI